MTLQEAMAFIGTLTLDEMVDEMERAGVTGWPAASCDCPVAVWIAMLIDAGEPISVEPFKTMAHNGPAYMVTGPASVEELPPVAAVLVDRIDNGEFLQLRRPLPAEPDSVEALLVRLVDKTGPPR